MTSCEGAVRSGACIVAFEDQSIVDLTGPPPRDASDAKEDRHLVCVLANPPVTSGARTMARIDLARATMGFESAGVVNLFSLPSRSTKEISVLGATREGWQEARLMLGRELDRASAVLLAYGSAEPTGRARGHHRDQVDWLRQQIARRSLPAYQLGDAPHHPSRWQRWTYRTHPGEAFAVAVRLSLAEVHEVGHEGPRGHPDFA